ncbi:MAG: phosphoenolpyruvate carboxykinase (ATP) [Planctomycetota bacterium]
MNTCDYLYVVDGYAGWDPGIASCARHLLTRLSCVVHNMLIRPTAEELASYSKPDFVIFNAGSFPANQY